MESRHRQPGLIQPPPEALGVAPPKISPQPIADALPAIAKITPIDRTAPTPRFNTIGGIDGLLGSAVLGWAYDRDFVRRRVKITMYVNGILIAETTANGLRRELVGIGGHDGFSGFICAIPPERFAPGATVRLFADGTELGAAPLILGPKHVDGVVEPMRGATVGGWVRERVLASARAVLDMYIDGRLARTIVADRLRPELKQNGIGDGCFGFAERLPDSCLDGGEHRIEFRHRASGIVVSPGALRFRASFLGVFERLDQYGGGGWIFCREAPDRPVRLDVVVNGERVSVVADRSRLDVQTVHGVDACGFDFRIPDTVSRHRSISVELLVAGTTTPALPGPFTFTPVSRIIEELEAIAAKVAEDEGQAGAGRTYSAIREVIVPNILDALRSHERRTGPLDLTMQVDFSRFQSPAPAVGDIVDVVIPVYRGHDETIACIESVIHAANKTRREVVVVDDRGPDQQLRAALEAYERAGMITLVVNPGNLGFPGAANAGMALHPDRDVILLNSDTLVPKGWIDRLRAAAYRSGNIGSVTPLSNRATICSYPESNKDNELPKEITWQALDAICAEVNDGRSVELPTAVGFCAYLRRAMLRETGLLNVERWKKGYGEENELCILAAARGWKHVLAPNLFVVHHGAVSFGIEGRKAQVDVNLATLNRFYPDYIPRVMEFVRNDPPAAVRRAIDWARLRQLSNRFVLFVSHAQGGGTAMHVEWMVRGLAAQGCQALTLEANSDNRGLATISNTALGTKSVYALPHERGALIEDLRGCGVWHVHFHHIMGGAHWAELPAQLGCTYDVTVHDYSFFCPRLDLLDERRQYCGEPELEVCQSCTAMSALPVPDVQANYRDRGNTITGWIGVHAKLLTGARRVFVPSRDVAARMERHIPGVHYEVRYHPETARRVAIRRPASSAVARVAVIGAIGPNKGYDLLLLCARDASKRRLPVQFNIFGYTEDNAPFRDVDTVRLVGRYTRDELPRLIAENPCDLALFLTIIPETYCYALTDAYALGLYPIALAIGAVEERIAASGVGTLLPLGSTPEEINAAILAEVANSARWPTIVETGEDCSDVLADYYRLSPPGNISRRTTRRRNRS